MKTMPYFLLLLFFVNGCAYVPTHTERESLENYKKISAEADEKRRPTDVSNDIVNNIDSIIAVIEDECVGENLRYYFNPECSAHHMIVTKRGSHLKESIEKHLNWLDADLIKEFNLDQNEVEWVRSFEKKQTIETLIFLTELKLGILKSHAGKA
jgi:hypothetical protein